MYKKLLRRFFKENSVKDSGVPSSAAIAHFQIKLLLSPDANEQIQGFMDEMIFEEQPRRKATVLTEKEEIGAASCEEIIRMMRRHPDPMNQQALVSRALEFEDALIPEVLRMLKTSLNDGFIEIAARVLSMCVMDISEALVAYYDDVRNPYAQSMILVVLGFKADEAHIPWIIEQYHALRRKYPNDSYCDGAYYALDEIESRFYSEKRGTSS